MAKKIRFPLKMDNGVEVRSMEELREYFSLAKVLEHFKNGTLVTWLRDHYEIEIADAVEALEQNEPELARKLSEIFDVPYDENTEEELKKAEERAERLERLKEFTDDEQFFDKIDYVAFEQDELYDLLDEDAETIYLCGDRFSIPLSKSGVRYIGINNPTAVINSKAAVDWDDKKISIEGVTFDEKYQEVVERVDAAESVQKKNSVGIEWTGPTEIVSIGAYSDNTYFFKDKDTLKTMLLAADMGSVKNNYNKAKNVLEVLNYDINEYLVPNSKLLVESK